MKIYTSLIFPLVSPPCKPAPRARGVEDLQRLFLCVKPSSYMYRQTYQKQGLILKSYHILRWTNVTDFPNLPKYKWLWAHMLLSFAQYPFSSTHLVGNWKIGHFYPQNQCLPGIFQGRLYKWMVPNFVQLGKLWGSVAKYNAKWPKLSKTPLNLSFYP